MDMDLSQKRMSIRNVALTYGLPSRVVARAVESGELKAIKTVTETGRERSYIAKSDAEIWFSSLFSDNGVEAESVEN
jgi:hypothetical protein